MTPAEAIQREVLWANGLRSSDEISPIAPLGNWLLLGAVAAVLHRLDIQGTRVEVRELERATRSIACACGDHSPSDPTTFSIWDPPGGTTLVAVSAPVAAVLREVRRSIVRAHWPIGRSIRKGDLDVVIPLDSAQTLDAAASRAREAEMARRIVAGGPVAIVALGGDHDLRAALQASGRPFTYGIVEAPTYKRLAN